MPPCQEGCDGQSHDFFLAVEDRFDCLNEVVEKLEGRTVLRCVGGAAIVSVKDAPLRGGSKAKKYNTAAAPRKVRSEGLFCLDRSARFQVGSEPFPGVSSVFHKPCETAATLPCAQLVGRLAAPRSSASDMKKNWLIGGLAGVLMLAGVAFVQGGGAEGEDVAAESGQPIAFPAQSACGERARTEQDGLPVLPLSRQSVL